MSKQGLLASVTWDLGKQRSIEEKNYIVKHCLGSTRVSKVFKYKFYCLFLVSLCDNQNFKRNDSAINKRLCKSRFSGIGILYVHWSGGEHRAMQVCTACHRWA